MVYGASQQGSGVETGNRNRRGVYRGDLVRGGGGGEVGGGGGVGGRGRGGGDCNGSSSCIECRPFFLFSFFLLLFFFFFFCCCRFGNYFSLAKHPMFETDNSKQKTLATFFAAVDLVSIFLISRVPSVGNRPLKTEDAGHIFCCCRFGNCLSHF